MRPLPPNWNPNKCVIWTSRCSMPTPLRPHRIQVTSASLRTVLPLCILPPFRCRAAKAALRSCHLLMTPCVLSQVCLSTARSFSSAPTHSTTRTRTVPSYVSVSVTSPRGKIASTRMVYTIPLCCLRNIGGPFFVRFLSVSSIACLLENEYVSA